MWYPQLKYAFKKQDIDYINALITLIPEAEIGQFTISGQEVSVENKTFKDLTSLLEANEAKPDAEITINTCVSAAYTVHTVFPEFQSQHKYLSDSKNDREIFKSDIVAIKEFFLETGPLRKPFQLSQISSREDALKVLNLVHEQMQFRSAIDFPSIQRIYIITGRNVYWLNYGDNKNIMDFEPYAFDMDDGFFSAFGGRNDIQEMKDAFAQWKQNGRKGSFFSDLNNPLLLKDSSENRLIQFQTKASQEIKEVKTASPKEEKDTAKPKTPLAQHSVLKNTTPAAKTLDHSPQPTKCCVIL